MRADAKIETKVLEHEHVVARQIIGSDIGVAMSMADLNLAPRRVASDELRVLRGVEKESVGRDHEWRAGRIVGQDKGSGERVGLRPAPQAPRRSRDLGGEVYKGHTCVHGDDLKGA